ncbi:Hypothetical predicted protein, partial [Marmota monax]
MDLLELDEASTFLRSEADLLLLQTMTLVGKKKYWVCDGKNSYIEAMVKGSEDDGKIIVETREGK